MSLLFSFSDFIECDSGFIKDDSGIRYSLPWQEQRQSHPNPAGHGSKGISSELYPAGRGRTLTEISSNPGENRDSGPESSAYI